EQPRLRLGDAHAADPLELLELTLFRLFQLVLELLDVHLAVGEALIAALELLLPALGLVFAGQETFLDLRHPCALFSDLALDLGSETDGLPRRLDLGPAAER